jgi:hypothetical protein
MSWNGVFHSYLWERIQFSASPTIKIKATLKMFIITGVTKTVQQATGDFLSQRRSQPFWG